MIRPVYSVWCDAWNCSGSAWIGQERTRREAHAAAMAAGWFYVKRRYYCTATCLEREWREQAALAEQSARSDEKN